MQYLSDIYGTLVDAWCVDPVGPPPIWLPSKWTRCAQGYERAGGLRIEWGSWVVARLDQTGDVNIWFVSDESFQRNYTPMDADTLVRKWQDARDEAGSLRQQNVSLRADMQRLREVRASDANGFRAEIKRQQDLRKTTEASNEQAFRMRDQERAWRTKASAEKDSALLECARLLEVIQKAKVKFDEVMRERDEEKAKRHSAAEMNVTLINARDEALMENKQLRADLEAEKQSHGRLITAHHAALVELNKQDRQIAKLHQDIAFWKDSADKRAAEADRQCKDLEATAEAPAEAGRQCKDLEAPFGGGAGGWSYDDLAKPDAPTFSAVSAVIAARDAAIKARDAARAEIQKLREDAKAEEGKWGAALDLVKEQLEEARSDYTSAVECGRARACKLNKIRAALDGKDD